MGIHTNARISALSTLPRSYMKNMSSTIRTWAVAASIAAEEAMKDQGFCRWNYTMRSFHQYAKNHVKSISELPKKLSSPSSAAVYSKLRADKTKQSEESLRKVMNLSCWGPY